MLLHSIYPNLGYCMSFILFLSDFTSAMFVFEKFYITTVKLLLKLSNVKKTYQWYTIYQLYKISETN